MKRGFLNIFLRIPTPVDCRFETDPKNEVLKGSFSSRDISLFET